MRAFLHTVLVLLLAVAMPLRSPAAGPSNAIDSYLRNLTEKGKFSGDVLVAVHGRIVFERSYGDANYELHVVNTPATRYRIFSITKQFVAAAIMALQERGLLHVDDRVSRYVEGWPHAWDAVTLRELLDHSGGLSGLTELTHHSSAVNPEDVWAANEISTRHPIAECRNLRAISGRLANVPLLHTPGTTWDYSNFGYDVLGCVIERASGTTLANAVDRYVFRPAGMHDSGFVGRPANPDPEYPQNPGTIDRLATGYDGRDASARDRQQAMPLQYASAAAGDIYSTARDMLAYSRALYEHRVLSAPSQAEMLARPIPLGRHAGWGLGWEVFAINGHRFMEHTGGNNGHSASFTRFPEERATIIVLSNLSATDVASIRRKIAEILFGGKYRIPPRR